MTKINYKKLLNSKWTAVRPQNKEKHFLVIKVFTHPDDEQLVENIILEAVLTKRQRKLKPLSLSDQNSWLEGWK